MDTALEISSEIKEFPPIDETTFASVSKFKNFVNDINEILKVSNNRFGTNFRRIETNDVKFKEFSRNLNKIQKYTPLIKSYNNLINSANSINKNKSETINRFYENLFLFGIDVVLVHNQVFHKFTYTSVDYLANELRLVKIKNICGYNCYNFIIAQLKDRLEVWLNETKLPKQQL